MIKRTAPANLMVVFGASGDLASIRARSGASTHRTFFMEVRLPLCPAGGGQYSSELLTSYLYA